MANTFFFKLDVLLLAVDVYFLFVFSNNCYFLSRSCSTKSSAVGEAYSVVTSIPSVSSGASGARTANKLLRYGEQIFVLLPDRFIVHRRWLPSLLPLRASARYSHRSMNMYVLCGYVICAASFVDRNYRTRWFLSC